MNERKVIKDLKERNEKLSQQYDFNRIHLITLENKNHRLEQQLQAYKDKEDKIREMFKSEKLENLNKYYYGDSYEIDAHELRNDILQILNEGGKE